MARVIAFVPDLLFGSGVVEALRAAGHEVTLAGAPERLGDAEVLIVDLTADARARIEQARPALGEGPPRTLAFYAHVEHDVRDAARAAGFDLVVPRSRMARAAAQLVEELVRP